MRREYVVPLPITYDRTGDTPLPTQLVDAIRDLALNGSLQPGDHLPSTRALAARLGVARGTVVTAYEQLSAEGYLITAHGSGTAINPELPRTAGSPAVPETPATSAITLLPAAHPRTDDLADAAWRSAWREACTAPLADRDPLGLWELRTQVAEHIRRTRSMTVDPRHIAITGGAREGLALTLLAMGEGTAPLTIGVESPGYPSLRRVPTRLGHTTVELPTDLDGVDPARFPATDMDAVLITPNHQYPFGSTLPAPRRAELVRWARETGSIIIEDDFDSELHYQGMPSPPVAATERRLTVLLGTFSAAISPQLSCGYVVFPPPLIDAARTIRAELGLPVATITQDALARYMSSGALRRRTQRLRRAYRRRQAMVTEQLGDIRGARMHPISGGLHAVVETARAEDQVIAELEDNGIGVGRLSDYWGGDGDHAGIIFGFGKVDEETLSSVLPLIAAACTTDEHADA